MSQAVREKARKASATLSANAAHKAQEFAEANPVVQVTQLQPPKPIRADQAQYKREGPLKPITVPKEFQQMSNNLGIVKKPHQILPEVLNTTRLKPTAEQPEIYKSGQVEGNDAKWRDVSLRGFRAGPPVRLNNEFARRESARAERLSQTNQQEFDQHVYVDDSKVIQKELIQERRAVSARRQRPETSNSERIGRFMRRESAGNERRNIKKQLYFVDQNSVQAVIDAIKDYDLQYNNQAENQQMLNVLAQISVDLDDLKHYAKTEECQKPLESEVGVSLLERVKKARKILLADMNDGYLPLELYDSDEQYEMHSPDEWLKLHSKQFIFPDGKKIVGVPAKSRYLYKKDMDLEYCVVTGYSEEDNTFDITWIPKFTQIFDIPELKNCDRETCLSNIFWNNIYSKDSVYQKFDGIPQYMLPTSKKVKRLNLLFDDEDEKMWWFRRWEAHSTRRKIESEDRAKHFLNQNMKQAAQIREYIAHRGTVRPLEFRITNLLQLLSDVAGPTAEIVDNVFHGRVLDNQVFDFFFLQRLDQNSYANIIKRSTQLIIDVSANLVESNMLATVDYLRRSTTFDQEMTKLGLSAPRFTQYIEKRDQLLSERFISTYSGEFEPGRPHIALTKFLKRQARIKTIWLPSANKFRQAWTIMNNELQGITTLKGLYYFNFAAIIPFLALDQIELMKSGWNGGVSQDAESFQKQIGQPIAKPNQVEGEGQKSDQNESEIRAVPYYAHPHVTNLDQLGEISPALPLSINGFNNIAKSHYERLVFYLQEQIGSNMGSQLQNNFVQTLGNEVVSQIKDLEKVGRQSVFSTQNLQGSDYFTDMEYQARIQDQLSVSQLEPVLSNANSQVSIEMQADLMLAQSGDLQNQVSETGIKQNCIDQPRPRSLIDLRNFCQLIDSRVYDLLMNIADISTKKYLDMMLNFRVRNVIPYPTVISKLSNLFVDMKNNQLSRDASGSLIASACDPLFRTITQKYTHVGIVQLFISLDPFVRKYYEGHDRGKPEDIEIKFFDQNAFPSSRNDKNGVRQMEERLIIEQYQALNNGALPPVRPEKDKVEIENDVSFDQYHKDLQWELKLATVPNVVSLNLEFKPSIQEIRKSIEVVYDRIINFPTQIYSIKKSFPCLEHESVNLQGPREDHDPWLSGRYKELQDYLDETQQGPECLNVVLHQIIRQLYLIDWKDHVIIEEGKFEYEVKTMPYFDAFDQQEVVEKDVNHPEDQFLIDCPNWDYDENAKPVETEVEQKEAQHKGVKGEEEVDEDDENVTEAPMEVEIKKELCCKINYTSLSLRDLRNLLQKYTIIKELLRSMQHKIFFGFYYIDLTNALVILQRRVNLLLAQVIRAVQARTTLLAQQIIKEWSDIDESMQVVAQNPNKWHQQSIFVNNLHATIKAMNGKQVILERYKQVLEEFNCSSNDFLKPMQQTVEWFMSRAAGQTNVISYYLTYYKAVYQKEEKQEASTDPLQLHNLEKKYIQFYNDDFMNSILWEAKMQPKKIVGKQDGCRTNLMLQHKVLTEDKDLQRGKHADVINDYVKLTTEFAQNASLNDEDKFIAQLETIRNKTEQIRKILDQFFQEEKWLNLPQTDFSLFTITIDEFQVFRDFWEINEAYKFYLPGWMDGQFSDIDVSKVVELTGDWSSILLRLEKQFQRFGKGAQTFTRNRDKDRAACCADAEGMVRDRLQNINKFKEYMPLIEALRSDALEKQHWAEVSKYTKDQIQVNKDTNLRTLIAQGLLNENEIENVKRISEEAIRERNIHLQFEKMIKQWQGVPATPGEKQQKKGIILEMKEFASDEIVISTQGAEKRTRRQPYYIVKTFEETSIVLDEQFSILQGVRASPFAKFPSVEAKTNQWEDKLIVIQNTVEEWTKFQKLWLYLYPIFSSEDIQNQLKQEAILFQEVCKVWSGLTAEVFSSPNAFAMSNREQTVPKLQENYIKLEQINKSLSQYLHSKRMSFSRFFFLADDELLQILAQTKNVEMVQAHINKCFEGMKKLTFDTDPKGQKIITQMVSPEGEQVQFIEPIYPVGDADLWLGQIELQMKATISSNLYDAWYDYSQNVENVLVQEDLDPLMSLMGPRELWMTRWPAQIVYALGQTVWTTETQDSLDKNIVTQYLAETNNRIDRLVLWIGCTPDTIKQYPHIIGNRAIRTTITTLLTLWVHNRDVLAQLTQSGVDHNFLFESQLKYYYNDIKKSLAVKQVDATLMYQFEYLGNHSRLVITPLTDRCFLTLTSALAKAYGCAPQGPAGTGKSETVKDLAKSLAIGCYIFNCSEGLQEQSIARFFMGLCICGMYSCLDEFNRCRLDVLSVVAQQILTIQRAIRAKVKVFDFNEVSIRLNGECCGIFITMNPGYAGRTELPTNLKNLFRPICMTVPDYRIIAENVLFSSGYHDATPLSVKITQTLKLSSEQLSKISHYDFGMRALKSILNAASRLKRLYWKEAEDMLCLRAICDVNVPKFLSIDLPLFYNIISDLFMDCYDKYMAKGQPGQNSIVTCDLSEITVDVDADQLLERFIIEQANLMHVTPSPVFLEKTMQLYATMTVRHGLMNVGGTMTGKTTATIVLASALLQMRQFLDERVEFTKEKFTQEAYPLFYNTTIYKLNAKSITADELYGSYSEVSNEWTNGILCTIMKECTEAEAEEVRRLKWILIDSPVDALWIENLNTILDDAKRLCLTNGEVIVMTDSTTYIFEVRDLEVASPATVSRCGMIFYDQTVIEPKFMFKRLILSSLPSWFIDLDCDFTQTWPIFKLTTEQVITSGSDLSVSGKSSSGNLEYSSYKEPLLKVHERLQLLFEWMFMPIYDYMFANGNPVILQREATIINNLVKIMLSYLKQFEEPNEISLSSSEVEHTINKLPPLFRIGQFVDQLFTFALTWSLGAIGSLQQRETFNTIFKHIAYDIPQIVLYNASQANTDIQAHNGQKFNLKVQKSQAEQGTESSKIFADIYDKIVPKNKFIWRFEKPVPYTEDPRQTKDLIKLPHDVSINIFEAKVLQSEERPTVITSMYLSKQRDCDWIVWNQSQFAIPQSIFDDISKYNDTIVPTQDVISLSALTNLLSTAGFPIILAGPSGSGKTSIVKQLINSKPWICVKCCLTAKTSSTQIRSIVDTKIEKRRRGLYSFPKGKKAIFFVDDTHMPQKEVYGAQPPLEVLRELFEQGGWYDIDLGIFKKIDKMTSIMGCTTSGSYQPDLLPERLLHHLALISVPESSDDSFKQIFSFLLQPLAKICQNPGGALLDNIVSASVFLYRQICDQFKPTPAHMHYLFGPRDLSKVFQGLLVSMKNANLTENSFKEYFSKQDVISSLWVHECQRIFSDRLINDDDLAKFTKIIQQSWVSTNQSAPSLERILPEGCYDGVNKFYNLWYSGAYNNNDIPYMLTNINNNEQRDMTMKYYDGAIGMYNIENSSKKMNLILFRYALIHLIRISRILQLDRGHGLMIGMPSSGKRSLTRLAAASLSQFYGGMLSIRSPKGYNLSTSGPMKIVEPTSKADYMDNIAKAIKISGVSAQPCTLIVQEALLDNAGLEAINFLINLGEIPNMFNNDDTNAIMDQMQKELSRAKPDENIEPVDFTNKQAVFEIIADRVVRNLHIVLTVTPGSLAFDAICTLFPSLLGSFTVNWFTPWETDTLRSIGKFFLQSEPDCEKIVEVLVQIHKDSEDVILKRYPNLCTSPATFLEFISNFQRLKKEQTKKLDAQNARYATGVQRLQDTSEAVTTLKADQAKQQPILQTQQVEVSAMAKVIDDKQKEMTKVKEVLSKEEEAVKIEKDKADALEAECSKALAEAEPSIQKAQRALGLLKPENVNEIKIMQTPPNGVRLTMDAVCVVLGKKIKIGEDNWVFSQNILKDPKFLLVLKGIAEITPAASELLGKHFINDPNFQSSIIFKASYAAAGICEWIHGMYDAYNIMLEVRPKQRQLAEAQALVADLTSQLNTKQAELQKAEDQLNALKADAQKAKDKLEVLKASYEQCCTRLKRAETLMSSLASERTRWAAQVTKIKYENDILVPTSLLATAYVAELGGMEFTDREHLVTKWTELITNSFKTNENNLDLSDFKLSNFVADEATIQTWISQGLPKDNFNKTSAAIARISKHVPLLLDPQSQARKWAIFSLISSKCSAAQKALTKVVKYSDQTLSGQIIDALRQGVPLIVDGIGNDNFIRNDPVLKAAITAHNQLQQTTSSSTSIPYGDDQLIVPNTFSLTLIATYDLPVPPDAFGDFSIVTFKATTEALQDQLISTSVEVELPQLEKTRLEQQEEIAKGMNIIQDLETNLLQLLNDAQADSDDPAALLDNLVLINSLAETQTKSQEVNQRLVTVKQNQLKAEKQRAVYTDIARDSAALFFCVLRLTNLDSMYENSLQNFRKIYIQTLQKFQKDENETQVETITTDEVDTEHLPEAFQQFAERVYATVSRGLFVNHKITFSMDIALSLQQCRGQLTRKQYNILKDVFAGNFATFPVAPQSDNMYAEFGISNQEWTWYQQLCLTNEFTDLNIQSLEIYKKLFADNLTTQQPLSPLSYVLFSVLLKKKDIVKAARSYIAEAIGPAFNITESASLVDICEQSQNTIPTIILLSNDSDPSNQLISIGESKKFQINVVSLGRGQGPKAEKAISQAVQNGEWVLLGNSHLAGSWFQKLESIVEQITENQYKLSADKTIPVHQHFRLFITTMPFDGFPASIIRQATKVSAESPMGVKNNFVRLFSQNNEEEMGIVTNADLEKNKNTDKGQVMEILNSNYQRLLWNLTTFFSVTLERRRFGPIGFSFIYDWADPDYVISKMQLRQMMTALLNCSIEDLSEKLENLINAFKFLFSNINVGGRVSDAKDQIVVNSLMGVYYAENLGQLGKKVEQQYSVIQYQNNAPILEQAISHVQKTWADIDIPDIFGLDANSVILLQQSQGKNLLQTTLEISQGSGAGAGGADDSVEQEIVVLQKILDELPKAFPLAKILEKYPTSYLDSMNTVLSQEATRYNNLLRIIERSLNDTIKSLRGEILKTRQTDSVRAALKLNAVPDFWGIAAWPSLMSLSAWLVDLVARFKFILQWTEAGSIKTVWFSGFFYPQAFITGTLQNYARRNKIPIDQLVLDFDVLFEVDHDKVDKNYQVISGLSLQGASLSREKGLVDSRIGVLFEEVPIVIIKPTKAVELKVGARYRCPCYRTALRKGVLTTTGHSSNYIFDVIVKCSDTADKWVRKGAAMFQQKE